MAVGSMKAIVCKVASEEYALDVNHVLSIERIQDIRPVPHTEDYIAGIMQLRGNVIPVMDLKAWLGMKGQIENTETQAEKRIIVTEYDKQHLGLIVDSATDVLDIEESLIQTVEMQEGKEINQVANLQSRLILILNIPRLLQKVSRDLEEIETA